MFLADLHTHSTFSDGTMSIPELVDFYGERKFGAIAITDHICETKGFMGVAAKYLNLTLTEANFPLYLEILKSETRRAWQKYRMVVIPGFEISKNSLSNHRSAHLLALGATKFVSANGSIDSIIDEIRAQEAACIAAHPVSTRKFEMQTYHLWGRRAELSAKIDAWEVASGPTIFNEVLESGLPMLASSDLHRPEQIKAWKTVFSCRRDESSILQAIRDQDLGFEFYEEGIANVIDPANSLRPGLDRRDRLRLLGSGASARSVLS